MLPALHTLPQNIKSATPEFPGNKEEKISSDTCSDFVPLATSTPQSASSLIVASSMMAIGIISKRENAVVSGNKAGYFKRASQWQRITLDKHVTWRD